MLDTFADFDDHEVLLLRDQTDVASGAVVPTAVKKLAFGRCSENFCMDWTYGTNNLGIYLSVLLLNCFYPPRCIFISVPAPLTYVYFCITQGVSWLQVQRGGIPVLDFIALDKRKTSMEAILYFFKMKN
uniref:Uncharacterized protein n=1 Tax=Phytophthora infestans TaxID=4787 RepID=Q572H7_PHYIN|nr:hypothetical protein PI49.0060c [Phytophthora infestans]